MLWNFFSREKFISVINKCSNFSALGPNRISWKHLKTIVKDNKYLDNIVNITNVYINLGYWLMYFKISLSIIISKHNKTSYDFLKSFYLIVLLNILGKLIEKFISKYLQFYIIVNNFVHPYQLRELIQQSTTDRGIFLIYIIHSGWIKNLQKSTLAFNITQFFPYLNHQLILYILDKAGFNPKVSLFISDYLVGRKT